MSFDIPAQDLALALESFAKQADKEVLFDLSQARGKQSSGVKGELQPAQALEALVGGNDLPVRQLNDRTFMVGKAERTAQQKDAQLDDAAVQAGLALVAQAPTPERSQAESEEPGTAEKSDRDAQPAAHPNEIVVTAQKRAVRLQDVPFALSALTNDDLENMGASGAADFLARVPGVHYNAQGRGRSPIVIRGVSTEGSNFSNLQSSIETFVDDLPTLNRWGPLSQTDLHIFDIERVEVLRGPQGTLFGSGALGGAVRVITNKPDPSGYEARVKLDGSLTDGGDPSHALDAMINIPLGSGKAAIRAVGYRRDDGGWIDNIRRSEKNVNGGQTLGGRVMLGIEPTDRLNLRLTLTHEDNEVDDGERTFIPAAGRQPYEWDGVLPAKLDTALSIANGLMEYDFGQAILTSSTTYSNRDSFAVFDAARVLATIFNPSSDPADGIEWIKHDTKTFAQELRITSDNDAQLLWTAGAFYMDQKIDMHQFWEFGLPLPLLNNFVFIDSREFAVFGEATYRFSDKFSLTAGARWFDSSFEVARNPRPDFFGTPPLPATTTASREVNPKISASYYPVPDIHLYATASQGYRIGQTNFNAGTDPNIPTGYAPDTLWNYEIGMKSEFFDRRLKANLAAFYIDWSDIQLTRFITLTNGLQSNITDNAGDAEIKGIEGELVLQVADRWEFGTALSYLDSEIVAVLSGVPPSVTYPGAVLPGSPDFSMSNYVQFSSNFGRGFAGSARLGHRYVGELYSNANNLPFYEVGSYSVYDMRLGIQYSNYEIALYAENLANREAVTSADANAEIIPYYFRLRPRTIGVTFGANF